MPQVLMDKCTVMPMSVGPDADGVSMLPLATKANKVGQTAAMLQPYGRCLAPIDAAGHIATSSHGRMHRIANTTRLSALDSESLRRTHFALSLQEWHAPHSSTASNLCTCTAEWECESPRARSFELTTEAKDTRLSALDIEPFLRARVALAACPAKPDCSASNCKMDVLHVGWKRESSRPRSCMCVCVCARACA
jgi:hypothetical protein